MPVAVTDASQTLQLKTTTAETTTINNNTNIDPPLTNIDQQPRLITTQLPSDQPGQRLGGFTKKMTDEAAKLEAWAADQFKTYKSDIVMLKTMNNDLLKQAVKLENGLRARDEALIQPQDRAEAAEARLITLETNFAQYRRAANSEELQIQIKALQMQVQEELQLCRREQDRARRVKVENDELRAFRDRITAVARGEDGTVGQSEGARRDSSRFEHGVDPPTGPRNGRWQ